jgi:hypothetical protein
MLHDYCISEIRIQLLLFCAVLWNQLEMKNSQIFAWGCMLLMVYNTGKLLTGVFVKKEIHGTTI